MIIAYLINQSRLEPHEITLDNSTILEDALWVDITAPIAIEEETIIAEYLKIQIPTIKTMRGIELSRRFFSENSALFMTTMVLTNSDMHPNLDPVTFILTAKRIITIHYIEPQTFQLLSSRLSSMVIKDHHPEKIFIGLLQATVSSSADILERMIHQLDHFSKTIFRQKHIDPSSPNIDYQTLLQNIGAIGDLSTKVRESLISLNLLISYLESVENPKLSDDTHSILDIIAKDINSLSDHVNFISDKINFLLDGTLGMVNIEQSNIIKIFSVAAVMFLPPTLIASIYGMNFKFMPELDWYLAYPLAIGLMILSALLPYKYFKKRKWF